ncbi:TauD/TfdA family dioxygenase [Achromobacter sp. MFA1 R4]|uniref:condensation domain-containing protein n=1 Tax=Achromobacter sp. MFA1 R4 TaxID=1881016 RepID=UPI00095375EE|nr:TauD/TfdA family dioxygenase [Achromobacter sp. MFA1 R4]SIT01212.1 Acyl-CoA synthetase (AMP-forming)/AMP-acid ligase II [Achromobacter sp. MFA1 R4]
MNHPASLSETTVSIAARLRELAHSRADDTALIVLDAQGETSYSYGALDLRVRALAAALQARYDIGSRLLLLLDNDEHYVIAFFACMAAGMTSVPAFPPQSARDQQLERLRLMARDCQAAGVLTTANVAGWLQDSESVFAGVDVMAADRVDTADAQRWRPFEPAGEDVAFLQYTSGSTAAPKGVMVTHANLMANERSIQSGMLTRREDTFVSWLPLYHDMGLIGALLQPVYVGCRVVLMTPKYFLERPLRWLDAISTYRATVSGGPDFAYRLCVERVTPEQIGRLDLSHWRIAFSGAEPVRNDTVDGFAALCAPAGMPRQTIYPCYGLAEATLFVSGNQRGDGPLITRFDEAGLAGGQLRPAPLGTPLVACGVPAADHRVLIADPATAEPAAPGTLGEIWTAGPSIAAGYWGNPEATQKAFVERDGLRWLRSGDLGGFHGGQLYVNGRLKDLIIVRGHNVYPQDIERVIEARVDGVRKGRAAVFRVDGPQGEGIGVAVEISRTHRKKATAAATVTALNHAVGIACGEPAFVTLLLEPGALPKTSSGKLQRAATRQGWLDRTLDAYAIHQNGGFLLGGPVDEPAPQPARGDTEQALAAIWAEVLAREAPGRDAHFFDLGGNSLSAAQVAARIRAHWSVDMPLRAVFEHPELAQAAALIDTLPRLNPGHESVPVALAPARRLADMPLSPAQQRLWLVDRLAATPAQRAAYNLSAVYELQGELDLDRMARALDGTLRRHEILRSIYPEDEHGDPVARVLPSVSLPLPVTDLGAQPDAAPAHIAACAAQPFDLATGPLLRAAVLRLAPGRHLLVLAAHHIVFDGWSAGVFLRELCAGYEGRELPPLTLQYGDYAAWSQSQAQSPAMQAGLDHWRRALAGAPALSTLPGDRERAAVADLRGATLRLPIPATLTRRLADLARRHDATLFQLLLASFLWVLHRRSGQDELVIGTDVAGRDHVELAPLIGFFVNVVPLRMRVRREQAFADWLAQVRDGVLTAFEHRHVPFDRIVDATGAARDRSRNPLVQVLFVMQNTPQHEFTLSGLAIEPRHAPATDSKFDLGVFVHEHEQGLNVAWTYATALYDPPTIERVALEWAELLRQVAAEPGLPLSGYALPSFKEPRMSVANPSPAAKLDRLRSLSARGAAAPAAAPAAAHAPIRTSFLSPDRQFPIVVEALDPDLDPIAWAAAERTRIERWLEAHGGILFRNFAIGTAQQFESFAESVEPVLYGDYGDLPKKEGGRNTYRSTPYPEKQMILYHNESAHLDRWPRKQLFFCELPSRVGGATPIVDCREMLRRLPGDLVQEFERKQLLYIRTFTDRLDVRWQSFFKTDDRRQVEATLRQAGIDFAWVGEDALQTRTRCPAVITHPVTGERVFFNQVQLHHLHCLEPEVRDHLLSTAGLERVPRHVCFGDGSPIPDAVMDLIGKTYEDCAVRFDWRRGDVVMLDNMLAAHARDPYEEPRKVVVAMGSMFDRAALGAQPDAGASR